MFAAHRLQLTTALPVISGIAPYRSVCAILEVAISNSSYIFYPGDPSYITGISHWSKASIQQSACVVEPATAHDVGSIPRILSLTATPFAVKGGGHTGNPTFSSTLGVHIAMSRFSDVIYDESSQSATIGAGMIWDDVYVVLDPLGVSVLGGRVTGVGVAGFCLGGGYSWFANQYGLTVDTIKAFELVQPSGNVITVTRDSHPDLFFGLKGGGNNFGIVTRFTLQTHEQGLVWGGLIVYSGAGFDRLKTAITTFIANVTDPKAQIIPSFGSASGSAIASLLLFYDGANPPAGVYDEILAIPNVAINVKTKSLGSLVAALYNNDTASTRDYFNSISVKYWSAGFVDAVINETQFWGTKLLQFTEATILYSLEPFFATYLSHTNLSSAWPPNSTRSPSSAISPLSITFSWTTPSYDQIILDAIRASAGQLKSFVVQEQGQASQSAPVYPNYAIFDTPLQDMYGDNVPTLQALALKYDPLGVMKMAGGFKF